MGNLELTSRMRKEIFLDLYCAALTGLSSRMKHSSADAIEGIVSDSYEIAKIAFDRFEENEGDIDI
jgi:hypothetical protein